MNTSIAETVQRLVDERNQCAAMSKNKSDPCADVYTDYEKFYTNVIGIISDAYETLDRCRRDMPRCEMLKELEEKLA